MYLYTKAFHLIFMTAWFAGLFYLPRLFVYHAMVPDDDTAGNERFKIMERKLYRFVTPFMIFTVGLGIFLIYQRGMEWFRISTWLHIKVVLVVLLIAYHFYCGFLVKRFAKDEERRGHVFFRFFNEAPVLILFAVVILAVAKPFMAVVAS